MATPAATKTKLIQDFRIGEQDTGSPEVQVALLSERIKGLTDHFKSHKSDYAGRRGLLMMVSKRNTLLKFLKSRSRQRYEALTKRLGLRAS